MTQYEDTMTEITQLQLITKKEEINKTEVEGGKS